MIHSLMLTPETIKRGGDMGILSKIFGSNKAIESGFDLIDKAFYTGEEKAEDANKRTNIKINLLKAYEAFKVTQRFLALLYGIPYATAWFVTFVASFFVPVEKQFEILTNSDIAIANLIILGFYFAGGMGEGVIAKYASVKKMK